VIEGGELREISASERERDFRAFEREEVGLAKESSRKK